MNHLELLKKYMREVYDSEGETITERVILYAELGDKYSSEELALLRSIQAEVCHD